jgi:hypothetical protein
MVVDLFLGTISIPRIPARQDSPARLAEYLEDYFFRRKATLSELASLRGRSTTLPGSPTSCPSSPCSHRSSVPTRGLPTSHQSSHACLPFVSEAAVFIRSVLEDSAEIGRPLWPPVPSSLDDAFLASHACEARVVVITWDSSGAWSSNGGPIPPARS